MYRTVTKCSLHLIDNGRRAINKAAMRLLLTLQIETQLEKAGAAYHIARKSIPSKAGPVAGIKLELFIFDTFPMAQKTALVEVLCRFCWSVCHLHGCIVCCERRPCASALLADAEPLGAAGRRCPKNTIIQKNNNLNVMLRRLSGLPSLGR